MNSFFEPAPDYYGNRRAFPRNNVSPYVPTPDYTDEVRSHGPPAQASPVVMRNQPHHYVPPIPEKHVSMPLFDSERGMNIREHHMSTQEHIRHVGVPVIPMGDPTSHESENFGAVPVSRNKAFLRHLQNHRNFDTMKSLKTSNDCPLCQLFLAEEGVYRPARLSNVGAQQERHSVPLPPVMDHPQLPRPEEKRFVEEIIENNQRNKPRPHVRDVWAQQTPLSIEVPQEPMAGPKKMLIPLPDYDEREYRGQYDIEPDYPQTPQGKSEEQPVAGPRSSREQQLPPAPKSLPEPKVEHRQARVAKDYKKRGEADISVSKGHIVELLEQNGKWARVRTIDGMVGFVPNRYLIL